MSKQSYIRSSLAIAATEFFSPIVRADIVADKEFRSELQLSTDAVVKIGKEQIEFQRSALFDAIRAAFESDQGESDVTDIADGLWHVTILRDGKVTTVAIAQADKRFMLSDLELLSPNMTERLEVFRHKADVVNLPENSRSNWKDLLAKRPPDDDEIGLIQSDLNETPVMVHETLRVCLANGKVSIDDLVPRSARYYERLVGRCVTDTKIEDYVTQIAVPFMRSIISWKSFHGYQFALLLTSHPAFSQALDDIDVEDDVLKTIFDWAATTGDAIARATCIEIGLRRVSTNPGIMESLSRVIDSFVLDKLVASVDQFKLLSAVFIAVYGQMSFSGMFLSSPPFWRRLAALAHASLIVRLIIANGSNGTALVDWLVSIRRPSFVLQCYVDMRLEPRWFSELAMPEQFRNELVGRAWLASKSNEAAVTSLGWTERLLGLQEESLPRRFELSRAFLPGPLEGGGSSIQEMPHEHVNSIHADLTVGELTTSSFLAFANAALFYRPSPQLAEIAAAAIVRADYRLIEKDPEASLDPILFATALFAANARSFAVADALFVVLRKYRRFYPEELTVSDAFRVALVASASREELLDWAKCVGDCMNDLAFQKISPEEADILHSHVVELCSLVPELWATCGQAEAALQALTQI